MKIGIIVNVITKLLNTSTIIYNKHVITHISEKYKVWAYLV